MHLRTKPGKGLEMPRSSQQLKACEDRIPLCVDLDGTLVRTDTFLECLLSLVKRNPRAALLVPFWLCKGKAHLKHQVAIRTNLDVANLPYNNELLSFLRKDRDTGRQLVLVTAADRLVAGQIATHLDIFDSVMASDGQTNLKGKSKLEALLRTFGAGNFEYVGNAKSDLEIWKCAAGSIVVSAYARVSRRAQKVASVIKVLGPPPLSLDKVVLALRPHQWLKNLLLFVPLITSHHLSSGPMVAKTVYAFLAFSLCASAGYLINDLLDLETDRQHPIKKHRPLAAGSLAIAHAVPIAALLGVGAVLFSLVLSPEFVMILGLYLSLSIAYTIGLKRIVLIDVLVLASLYTVRIFAGGIAIDVPISSWLWTFSMFIFVSLALVKRVAELQRLPWSGEQSTNGRGYLSRDMEYIAHMGPACGFIAVLVFGLYISSESVKLLYGRPEVLWGACALIFYWISRVWLLAHRGQINEDPIVFALKDKTSYAVGILVLILAVAARWT